MRYLDAFRNPDAAAALRDRIARLGEILRSQGRRARIMEVCGTHTMAIARYGIRDILPEGVEVISGPGCPVCVTPTGYIDAAVALAERGAVVISFGDMLRVPGSTRSLAECRAAGGEVQVAYSPSHALAVARGESREVVFLGIGFETTTAPVVSLVERALAEGIENLSLLTAFRLVPPALHALLADLEVGIDAFLCPAHVSAIIGAAAYRPFAGSGGSPCVIAGFEPLDILLGLAGILEQLVAGVATVDNQYSRVVKDAGNPRALAVMERYLEPVDAFWRGMGTLPRSGLGLREPYRRFDAAARHGVTVAEGKLPGGCRCGEVVKGKLRPEACPLFGTGCTPASPVGPCMVSSEGSCAASYKYARIQTV